MIGEVYKKEDGTLAARTVAGPVGGTIQKQLITQDYDYEVALVDKENPAPNESYVGVSNTCPITYNPATGEFKVCCLSAGQVVGDLDATRTVVETSNANENNAVPILGSLVTIGDTTFARVCYNNNFTYNPNTKTLTVCNLVVDCIEGQADADRVIVGTCNVGTLAALYDYTTVDGVTTAKVSRCTGVAVNNGALTSCRYYALFRSVASWCDIDRAPFFVCSLVNDSTYYYPIIGARTTGSCGWSLGTFGEDFAVARKNGIDNNGARYCFYGASACGGKVLTSGSIGAYGFTTCTGTVKACLCGTVLCLGT